MPESFSMAATPFDAILGGRSSREIERLTGVCFRTLRRYRQGTCTPRRHVVVALALGLGLPEDEVREAVFATIAQARRAAAGAESA